jgi:preprotein translocase subunit SecY
MNRFIEAVKNMFRIEDLRKRVLFTLALLAVYRIGAHIPTPGINVTELERIFSQSAGSVLGIFDLFSGGNFRRLTIFALGIMPYITSSIILQLMTVVFPYLERLQKEGELGRRKITQYTRYLTIVLSIIQSLTIAGTLQSQPNLVYHPGPGFILMTILTLTTGSAFIMWLGEQISERGIGNGMSLIIFVGIVVGLPRGILDLYEKARTQAFGPLTLLGLIFLILLMIAVIAFIVFVEGGQRRIPVQYAKRMVGRRMYGGTSTYLPLKVNQAGVIPVIFASSLIYIPNLITQLVHGGRATAGNSWWDKFEGTYLRDPSNPVYIGIYFGLIIFFTYFYVSITFNPDERADEMKKFGGFIPGIRPGRPTADYLRFVLSRITLPGSIYLGVIAVLPNLFLTIGNTGGVQNLPFGGTAVLIMIGVGLDTVKQIESQLMQRNYEGFLK